MLSAVLNHLFPGIDFLNDCVIVDDGNGPYIAAWNRPEPQPTQAEIDAAMLPATRTAVIEQIDGHARTLRDQIVAGISPAEMASWAIKRAEAQAYVASNNPTDAPMLAVEAASRAVSLDILANLVLQKAVGLAQLEAIIAGTAGRHTDTVRALAEAPGATADDLLAYDWSTGWPL